MEIANEKDLTLNIIWVSGSQLYYYITESGNNEIPDQEN